MPSVAEKVAVEAVYEPERAVAVVQSIFMPGLGTITSGHHFRGMVWFVCVVASYITFGGLFSSFLTAIPLHLICVLAAAFEKGPSEVIYMSPGMADAFDGRYDETSRVRYRKRSQS